MKISIILLDWSVRESFHAIYYLNNQSAVRSNYELIWVEYFDRVVPELDQYYHTGALDKYMILGHKPGIYNKHAAWNAAVLEASGDIMVLCDSDVIFRKSFIQSIIDFFASHNNAFLLIDEIRSENKQFWPFKYPAWEEVITAPGVVNWNKNYSVTNGLRPDYNDLPLWERMLLRNYGACLCVKKSDYIYYGGLDEHDSYEGYICGPYDLAVRMVNGGMEEKWHREEFLLHTYHPWINPDIDKMGPHFWHNSATSFKHMFDGNIMPYQENKEIRTLRRETYPELPRQGTPKFSIIIPNSRPHFMQRLYDSVKNATRFPFEVIFLDKTAHPAAEPYMTCLQSYGALYTRIIEGCQKAKGEIIVVAPAEAMFRPNALDKLLDIQKKLTYPIVCLNAIETFSQGFIWQSSSNKFTFDGQVGMMTAFHKLLTNELSELELRKIFSEGKKISSVFGTPLHLEIWHDNIHHIYNEYLESLLAKMVEIQYAILYKEDNNCIVKAVSLFNEIYTAEKNLPGNFLRYCLLKRYSLREYCQFINFFRHLNRIDLLIRGYELLITGTPVLTAKINEHINEFNWSYKLIYTDTTHLIGSAHYNLAGCELANGNRQKAISYLQACLKLIPGHQAAQKILAEIE